MTQDDRLRALVEAAEAVVARWDTPLWKDAEPTARVINRLRAALSALNQPPRETAEDRAGAALWREHDGRHGQAEEAVSVFDPSEPRPPKATGEWSDVWAKADARETEGEDVEGLIDRLWLCEKDDRTSPGEYPYMCLITHDELEALRSPQPWRPDREAVARIIDPEGWAEFDACPRPASYGGSTRFDAACAETEVSLSKADAILALPSKDTGWRPDREG